MMSSEEAIASEIYYRYEKGSQAFQFAASIMTLMISFT